MVLWVDHGSGESVCSAGVEGPGLQTGIIKPLDQARRALFDGLNDAKKRHDDGREDVFHKETEGRGEVTPHLSPRGVSGAHGDEAQLRVMARH